MNYAFKDKKPHLFLSKLGSHPFTILYIAIWVTVLVISMLFR